MKTKTTLKTLGLLALVTLGFASISFGAEPLKLDPKNQVSPDDVAKNAAYCVYEYQYVCNPFGCAYQYVYVCY